MPEPSVETNSETAGGPRTANDETTPDTGGEPDVQMSDPVERGFADKTTPDPGVVVGREMSEVGLPLKTIRDNCPPPGTEIMFAYKLKLGWVRDVLSTLRGTLFCS